MNSKHNLKFQLIWNFFHALSIFIIWYFLHTIQVVWFILIVGSFGVASMCIYFLMEEYILEVRGV